MLSGKWRPFCFGLNKLNIELTIQVLLFEIWNTYNTPPVLCTLCAQQFSYKKFHDLTFNVWGRVISVWLGQYHGCWCPGSLRRQDISSHDIDYVEYVGPGLTWVSISSTCVISMWNNDIKCKYMFMFPLKNLACKGLKMSSAKWRPFCPYLNVGCASWCLGATQPCSTPWFITSQQTQYWYIDSVKGPITYNLCFPHQRLGTEAHTFLWFLRSCVALYVANLSSLTVVELGIFIGNTEIYSNFLSFLQP